jgi:hypothetical protein
MQRFMKPLKRTALAIPALVLLACAAVGRPLPSAPGPASTRPLLLDEVNIVDVETGEVRYRQAVWIDHGRISRIADAAGGSPPAGGRTAVETALMGDGRLRVRAPGRFLLPGLSDMHTHSLQVSPQLHHPLWIAAGVTAVRDMGGCMLESDSYSACTADRKRWQEELQAGRRTSPNYRQHSSYQLNGGAEVPDAYPDFFRLRSAADARALLAHYRAQGTGFIKVYEQLSVQQYHWVAAAAKETGMTLAGHQPWLLPFADMLEAGQRSVEHGRVFLYACADAITPLKHAPLARSLDAAQWRALLDSQNPALCRELMERMARSQTWWSPTLLTLQLGAKAGDSAFRQDERLKFLPYPMRWLWNHDADNMLKKTHDANGVNVHAELFALAQRQLKQAHDAGVKILAGTDTPDSFVFAGSGLHDELDLYVQAGLTPLEAIRTATINPAVFAGIADRTGTIAVGKTADLLLLEDDPLLDLASLRRPEAVVLAGHWYPRTALSKLQEFSLQQAGSLRLNLRLAWDMASSPAMRKQLAD